MPKEQPSRGRDSLILAAERLVAERGLHGVRVSEVVREAGHRNNSAVTYHFGSWEGLLDAVWQRHTEPVSIDRAHLIATAIDRGTYDLPTMVDAYVRPFVDELTRHHPSHWARFNEQWIATIALDILALDNSAAARQPSAEATTVVHNLFLDMAGELTHLPAEHRTRRVALMARYVIAALAAWEREGAVTVGVAEIADGTPDATDVADVADVADELCVTALALLRA